MATPAHSGDISLCLRSVMVAVQDGPRKPRGLVCLKFLFFLFVPQRRSPNSGSRFCNMEREENRPEAIPAAPAAVCSGLLQSPPPGFDQTAVLPSPGFGMATRAPSTTAGSILKRLLALLAAAWQLCPSRVVSRRSQEAKVDPADNTGPTLVNDGGDTRAW